MQPVRKNDTVLLAAYDSFFTADRFVIAELTAEVIDRATDLRAVHNFSSPDALHLATAIVEKADIFLTGDSVLARCPNIAVEVLRPG